MAKIKLDPSIQDIRGKIGEYVIRRCHTGELVLSFAPDMSNVQWSDAQKAHRQRFKQAVGYARLAMADPQLSAHYRQEAARLNKRPFDMAVSDYFKDSTRRA